MTQDLWHAKLVVVKNFTEVERNVRVMAALTGSALISADVLLGHGGVKLVYHPGHKIEAAVFATNTFQDAGAWHDRAASGSLRARRLESS